MKKKILIIILIIIEIGLIMINYNTSLSNKEIDKIETKEKTEEIKGNNTLAIMLKGKDDNTYKPSDKNTWPESPYKYAGSLCIGNDGRDIEESEVISFNNDSHTATITTKDTIYCYLYFAEGEDAVTRIKRLSGTTLEDEQDVKAREDVLRRFQGTSEKVNNNYICFGTSITEECVNNTDRYMYRIIGYAIDNDETTNTKQGQLKLIKKEALQEAMQWHNSFLADVNFEEADIHRIYLPFKYWNSTNPVYVPDEWKDKVANHTWWLGDMLYTESSANQIGENVFKIENGKATTEYDVFLGEVDKTPVKPEEAFVSNVNGATASPYKGKDIYYKHIKEYWTKKLENEKVGLINASDYYLSVGANTNCRTAISKCQAGWIHLINNDSGAPVLDREWTMSGYGFDVSTGTYAALNVFSDGRAAYVDFTGSFSVRPVIYTVENMTLNGSGTITDPYIIIG